MEQTINIVIGSLILLWFFIVLPVTAAYTVRHPEKRNRYAFRAMAVTVGIILGMIVYYK